MHGQKRTGGAENLRGIHYQLLRSIFQATRILDLKIEDSDEPTWYKLVIEPRDGGDLQLEAPDAVDVEQMKVRARGSWPLYEVIHEILPDLYKAFAERSPRQPIREARFITDAKRGNWRAIEEIFRGLAPLSNVPERPSASLDSSTPLKITSPKLVKEVIAGGLLCSPKGLFDYICRVLAKTESPSREEERSVWLLLRAFRFTRIDGDSLRDRALAHIRGRVLRESDAEILLRSLLGKFLEKGKDNKGFYVRDLLADYGCADVGLWDRGVLLERGRRLLSRTLVSRGYVAGHDVRAWAVLPKPGYEDQKTLVFFGDSGKGKSWALYAYALRLTEQGRLVILVEAGATRSAIVEQASAIFCQNIWGQDGFVSLERLHARLKTLDPAHAGSWVDLLVNGVQSIDLAEQLSSYDWSEYGIRLSFALTCNADDIPRSFQSLCRLSEVGDFSTRELHDYLRQRLGDRALKVSYAEDSILHRPLMARIYCDLVSGETEPLQPTNEFVLLASYWLSYVRVRPLAIAAIARVAAEQPSGRAYPWTMLTLSETGLDEPSILDLCDRGLLRRSSDGRAVSLWHDQLLSWAAAEGWGELIRDGRLTAEELLERLTEISQSGIAGTWGKRWMGDALLNVLWLLLEPGWGFQSLADRIIDKLQLRPATISLLGDRVVPVLFERLRRNPERSLNEIQSLTGIRSAEVSAQACELLHDESVEVRLAAARTLIAAPTPAALDALWKLRLSLENQDPKDLNSIHLIANKALASCVRFADEWIRRRLLEAEPFAEPVHDLVYLLPQMERGRDLWFDLRDIILAKISGQDERSVIVCMESFHDKDHLGWLKERVQVDSPVGGAARRALFLLEPGRHPDDLEFDSPTLGITRGWWLLPHLNQDQAVAESFIARVVERASDPWASAWTLLSGFESRIAPATLDLLLDATAQRLAGEVETPTDEGRDPLWGPFNFLARVRSSTLIGRFEIRRDTDFESKLEAWLCQQGANNERFHDHRAVRAVRILKRIGGSALTNVAHCWLRSGQTFWALRDAVDLAIMRPDQKTADLLFEVAMRDEVEGSDHPFAQLAAIDALLTIGRKDLAVYGAMKWGSKTSWESIKLWSASPPGELQPVLVELKKGDNSDPNVVMALGLGSKGEHAALILGVLRKASKGSELARHCLLALYIGDETDEATQAFLEHVVVPETEYVCTLGLLKARTPEALTELKARLTGLKKERLSSSDNAMLIAINLLEIEETRREVAEALWESLDRHRLLFVVQGDLSAFAELRRADVDEWLYELALGEGYRHLDFGTQLGAIRALANRDPGRAFEAALRLTELDSANRDEVPALLIDIDPERALPILRQQAQQEDEILVLMAIGESLSAAGQEAVFLEWLQDLSPRVREAACIAAEVLPWSEDVVQALQRLLYDPEWDVRNAANQGLNRLWYARELGLLVEALVQESSMSRRWCLLDIMLEDGHPGLWRRQAWVTKLWPHLPLPMRQRAADRLGKRRKEVREKLKKRGRRDED